MNPLSTAKYITAALLLSAAASLAAAEPAAEPDVLDMSIEENLASPAVPQKARAHIRADIDRLRRHMLAGGYAASSTREGEVLEIVIPAQSLFAANDTVLKPSADKLLEPLGELARKPRRYKLVIAVHSDDTGDADYADRLTAARANAIDDRLWRMADGLDTNTVPYGLGRDEPLQSNASRTGREANRRVEIYVVPDRGMLEAAGVKLKK